MILTFIAPGAPHPIGGVTVIYEFASAMARRGHEVNLFHYPVFKHPVSGVDDIAWFSFPQGIVHHFPRVGFDPNTAPPSDIIFGFSTEDEMPAHLGLPVVLIQGYRMLEPGVEDRTYNAPCPKICVAGWLVEIARGLGVPDNELVHIPLGLRHDWFRLTRPIEGRPRRVSFCYNQHWQKGAKFAREVFGQVRQVVPDLDVVAFSGDPPIHVMPPWITYRVDPSQDELLNDIYNGSQLFLCPSEVEGFGLPCIEAMACGAALVTTDNGGSRDYAIHNETALVSPPGDLDAMVANVRLLLEDKDRRVELAEAGRAFVERFDWSRSGELLESFLEQYLADPAAHGRPS